ncbi:anti-sigma B factor antagonist/stage II sporulation protein AA (anti-sigma F factor antagonist) [Nonomuraea solani]|uniref:Anti-sigma factor antagonist n=1 Tax=Nonomuraea solani TaxID=1144553 RepID=A0A1H6EVP2_9ACTN|nr:STAS domain-containing protein [Nonomuraea solani]SEH01898.1 anti-sigma B factor antagonist/stage II sporulation protein AA (anti-sigma F factor antagonist) [Nonomuraea solani]
MDPLHLTTSRRDGALTVSVSGELDIATTELLRGHLLALLQEAGHAHRADMSLIIEMSRLSFIDAAGLGILVSVQNQALSQCTPLRIANVPPAMLRLLRITGLDTHLTPPL